MVRILTAPAKVVDRQSMIETRPATIEDAEPISALLTANAPGRGGALRPKGQLLKILNAAVQHNRVVKFELYDVKKAVGNGKNFQDFTLTDATVVRATDADLK